MGVQRTWIKVLCQLEKYKAIAIGYGQSETIRGYCTRCSHYQCVCREEGGAFVYVVLYTDVYTFKLMNIKLLYIFKRTYSIKFHEPHFFLQNLSRYSLIWKRKVILLLCLLLLFYIQP